MASFKFRLEPLLQQREIAEENCQRELAELMRQRSQLEEKLRQLQNSLQVSRSDMTDNLQGTVDPARIAQFSRFGAELVWRGQNLVVKLAAMEKAVTQARAKLLSATKERKALELLKTNQKRAWQQEVDRREAAEMDELALLGFSRKQTDA